MSKKRFDGPAGRVVPIKQSKEVSLDQRLNTPVTVAECLQLSQAVLSDFVNSTFKDELKRLTDIIVSQTIHIETMRDLLTNNGILTNEDYVKSLKEHTDDYNKQRKEYIKKIREENGNDIENDGSNTGLPGVSEDPEV